jgi:cytochrome c oxidase cbb3-type subunit 3/ubiquinol-cytochrome c reductase cytochrome c subunit
LPAPAKPVAKADDPNSLGGKEMYAALCAPCHGKALDGYVADHAPSLITPTFLESATDDFLVRSITTGRAGTSMAAYSKRMGGPLDDAAIKRLVTFIRERGNVLPKPVDAVKLGDAAKGAALYDSTCKSCHGDQKTRGEAVMLANTSFLAEATDAFLHHAIVNGRAGTKMEPFKDKLDEGQIGDVIAYIRTFIGTTEAAAPVAQLPAPTGKEPLVIFPKGKEPDWKLKEDRFVGDDVVKKAYDEKRAFIIIDARPPSEWMREHITGAVSIPYHDMARLAEIPKDTWVITYCACPHHLSGIVLDALRAAGHTKSAILDEGINDWFRKGYPMTTAPGVEKPPAEPVAPPGQIR